MADFPAHLLLPLLASLLFVCGLLFIKRASSHGVGPWTVTFIANYWAASIFSLLWFLGGDTQPLSQLWQPAVVASLYILGQIFTFGAIEHGDVSVATPVFGVKVIVVAFLLSALYGQPLSIVVWIAVLLSGIGIMLVQWTPRRTSTRSNLETSDSESPNLKRLDASEADSNQTSPNDTNSRDADEKPLQTGNLLLTIVLAMLASVSFGTFDVIVQDFAQDWGVRLVPVSYWIVALLSLGFLPFVDLKHLKSGAARAPLLAGTLLIALQAMCIVSTVSIFGDAARVNVMYTMRGMWGVLLAWLVAVTWGGSEASLPRSVMLMRVLGASFLTSAVILVVLSG